MQFIKFRRPIVAQAPRFRRWDPAPRRQNLVTGCPNPALDSGACPPIPALESGAGLPQSGAGQSNSGARFRRRPPNSGAGIRRHGATIRRQAAQIRRWATQFRRWRPAQGSKIRRYNPAPRRQNPAPGCPIPVLGHQNPALDTDARFRKLTLESGVHRVPSSAGMRRWNEAVRIPCVACRIRRCASESGARLPESGAPPLD